MILGIDASNIRAGGGITHIVELLRVASPSSYGFTKIIVWGGHETLRQIEDRPWLVKSHINVLDRSLPFRVFWQRFMLSKIALRNGCKLLLIPGGTYFGSGIPFVAMSQNLLPFEWRELLRFRFSLLTLKWMLLRFSQVKTFRSAQGVIFLTEYAREKVLRVTGPLYNTAIIPHGVDDRFVCPPRPIPANVKFSNNNLFHVLYVSKIDMYKHRWQVLTAVASLRKKGFPIFLDLVGPYYGPALGLLEKAISKYDTNKSFVRYHGEIPHSQLHMMYRQSDMVVFASSCETFGQILLEAMSAGLPIACSNMSAMPEFFKDSGLYFDPENAKSIETCMQDFFDSPELRNEKSWNAYNLSKNFSWEKCAASTFSFLRNVALKHSR